MPKDSHDEGQKCICVSDHHPEPLELERHHIWPLGDGGPDNAWNTVFLCPTTHMNVHELLRTLIRRKGSYTYRQAQDEYLQPVGRYAFQLALEGYKRIIGESR